MKFCQLCQTKKVLVPVGIAPIFQPRWPTAIPSRENMSGTAAMVFFFNSFEVGGEGNGGGHPYVVYIVHIYIYMNIFNSIYNHVVSLNIWKLKGEMFEVKVPAA